MVRQQHQCHGHEFDQTPGDSERQSSLLCSSPWGHKMSEMTQQLNNNNQNRQRSGIKGIRDQKLREYQAGSTTNWCLSRVCHLPLERLHPGQLQLLTFNMPSRQFRMVNVTLCAPRNVVKQVFRYMCSGTDFKIPILASLHIQKSTKSLMVTSAPPDQQKTFCKTSA